MASTTVIKLSSLNAEYATKEILRNMLRHIMFAGGVSIKDVDYEQKMKAAALLLTIGLDSINGGSHTVYEVMSEIMADKEAPFRDNKYYSQTGAADPYKTKNMEYGQTAVLISPELNQLGKSSQYSAAYSPLIESNIGAGFGVHIIPLAHNTILKQRKSKYNGKIGQLLLLGEINKKEIVLADITWRKFTNEGEYGYGFHLFGYGKYCARAPLYPSEMHSSFDLFYTTRANYKKSADVFPIFYEFAMLMSVELFELLTRVAAADLSAWSPSTLFTANVSNIMGIQTISRKTFENKIDRHPVLMLSNKPNVKILAADIEDTSSTCAAIWELNHLRN